MAEKFEQNAYWINRHEKNRGDPRSVGNMGKSIEDNLVGEKRFIAATSIAAHDLKPYQSVLDVGCGYGRIASCFCDAGYAYTGVDVAPAAIEAARKLEPRGKYVLGSALEADFDGKFDLITVLYVFVHFVNDDDWRALLNRLAGLLADGGALLIADDFTNTKQRPVVHVRQRSLAQYETELNPFGLRKDDQFKNRFAKAWNLGGSVPPYELFRSNMSK